MIVPSNFQLVHIITMLAFWVGGRGVVKCGLLTEQNHVPGLLCRTLLKQSWLSKDKLVRIDHDCTEILLSMCQYVMQQGDGVGLSWSGIMKCCIPTELHSTRWQNHTVPDDRTIQYKMTDQTVQNYTVPDDRTIQYKMTDQTVPAEPYSTR